MLKVKQLCVCGVAAMSMGAPFQAALAQCGTASWYHEGARTANGERYQPDGISAAHRSLPFGTRVEVRNQRTVRTVVVRINYRGPFIGGRIIDLSRGAKRVIGMDGLAPVCLTVLGHGATTVASAEDSDGKAVTRRKRTRIASLDREVRTSARVSRRKLARLSERKHSRLAALDRQERRAAARQQRLADDDGFERRPRRVAMANPGLNYDLRAPRFVGDTEM